MRAAGMLLSVLPALAAGNAPESTMHCDAGEVVLRQAGAPDTAADEHEACAGLRAAIRFLGGMGLRIPQRIAVDVVPRLPAGTPGSAYGSFAPATGQLSVLSLASLRARDSVMGLPVDPAIFRGLVAHEVAHAIAAVNHRYEPTMLGHEYIAYVTQFATLPAAQREAILARYDYDRHWRLYALVLYLGDPVAFGAHAWHHFQSDEGGPAFIRRILDGSAFDY